MYAVVDQLRLIVVIDNSHAFGECLVDIDDFFFYPLDHLLRVFVDPFQDNSSHDFALAVFRNRALTQFVPDFNLRHVAHANR